MAATLLWSKNWNLLWHECCTSLYWDLDYFAINFAALICVETYSFFYQMSFKFLETFVASADLECLLCSKCSSTSFNMWLSQSSVPNGLLWQHPRSHICQDVQRQRESQCIHFTFLTHVVGHHYRIVQMGWCNSFSREGYSCIRI